MVNVIITDGRTSLWQWDTGVQIKVLGCDCATECHFVTPDGLISRDVADGLCDVPDAALTTAGVLVVYVFARTEDGATTRHEFRIRVQDRPKPSDYIDPPDEADNLDALAERVAELIGPVSGGGITEESDPTVPDWAKQPEKPSYTAEEVGAVSQQELTAAVEDALQEAKESGEFKGDTPVKGTDYFTEADKSEMVASVKASLQAETWQFTLEDGSEITKEVLLK